MSHRFVVVMVIVVFILLFLLKPQYMFKKIRRTAENVAL